MRKTAAIAKESAPRPADAEIAALATRQHGVVARRQLRALGLSDGAIAHRVATGRLQRLHHGVYAAGHTVLGPRGRWSAAVLAAGPRAFLSHAAAGALWELRASAAVIVDVTILGGGSRKRAGLRIHRARSLDGQTTTHDGIPVTTPARTILDLAATLQRRPLERVLDNAENAQLTDVVSLIALARAHAGHRGASRLRTALGTHTPGTTITRSELEERFLALCDAARFERPLVNQWVEAFEVDFLFAEQRLVVETDGYRFHRTQEQFERDRHRDATLTRAGYRTLRFTHTQLTTEPDTVTATLRAALNAPNPGTPTP